jgi:hypothetical protein
VDSFKTARAYSLLSILPKYFSLKLAIPKLPKSYAPGLDPLALDAKKPAHPGDKNTSGLALDSSVHVSPFEERFPSLCLASNHKEALSMLGEAVTYFLTCPYSKAL